MKLVVEVEDRSHNKKRIMGYSRKGEGFEVGPYIEGFSKHTHHCDEEKQKIIAEPYLLSPEELKAEREHKTSEEEIEILKERLDKLEKNGTSSGDTDSIK